MKLIFTGSSVAATVCAAAIVIFTLSAVAQDVAQKRQRDDVERSGTFETSGGGTGTFDQTVYRQPDQTAPNLGWHNPSGGHGGRHVTNPSNKAAGTSTHHVQTTHPGGKTVSSEGKIKKTGTGSPSGVPHTGSNKKSYPLDRAVTKSGHGSAMVGTTTRGKTTTAQKGGGKSHAGYIPIGTATGPNSGSTAFDNDVPSARRPMDTSAGLKGGERAVNDAANGHSASNP